MASSQDASNQGFGKSKLIQTSCSNLSLAHNQRARSSQQVLFDSTAWMDRCTNPFECKDPEHLPATLSCGSSLTYCAGPWINYADEKGVLETCDPYPEGGSPDPYSIKLRVWNYPRDATKLECKGDWESPCSDPFNCKDPEHLQITLSETDPTLTHCAGPWINFADINGVLETVDPFPKGGTPGPSTFRTRPMTPKADNEAEAASSSNA
ncbi:MAG: hypothetical protein M1828_002968 [Chrysothrix sp. TS-e1954]|nr:MAG: hypothetical protein M1828_002968 [Chrysothrix sp. TS-e1954]